MMERAIIRSYLDEITRVVRSGSSLVCAARELLDELCQTDTDIAGRLERIELQPGTPLEQYLRTVVRLNRRER